MNYNFPKLYWILIPVTLFLGLFFIAEDISAATVFIDSCPSTIKDTIKLTGDLFGGYIERPCGPVPMPCYSWYENYPVRSVKMYLDGNYIGGPDWWDVQDPIDGDCFGDCDGQEYRGKFDTGDVSVTYGQHTLKICATDPGGEGCASCDFYRYRQENCCDNLGWDNVKRCGGCCGPAENCVGYDYEA